MSYQIILKHVLLFYIRDTILYIAIQEIQEM